MSQKPSHGLLCPSTHHTADGARLFGLQVAAPDGSRQLAYLDRTHPISDDILALAGEAPPHAVLRVAGDCHTTRCVHWNGEGCRLATRVATMTAQVVSAMPRCAIRPSCRWFKQEGPAACLRCPGIATIDTAEPESLDAIVSQLPLASASPELQERASAIAR